jgi:hypothetical protein
MQVTYNTFYEVLFMSRSLYWLIILHLIISCGDSKSGKHRESSQDPAIDEFLLTPAVLNLALDEKTGLISAKWRTSHVKSCELRLGSAGQSFPNRQPNDEVVGIPVTESTLVTLTCQGKNGSEVAYEKNIQLTRGIVGQGGNAAILSFSAEPQHLVLTEPAREGTVRLKWQAQHAESCVIERLKPYSATKVDSHDDDFAVQISEDTQLALTCHSSSGSAQKSLNITVGKGNTTPTPKILSLSVTPNPLRIFTGDIPQPIKISWNTQGMKLCGLHVTPASGETEYLGGIDANGTDDSFRINTTSEVKLVCQTPQGQDVSEKSHVVVNKVPRPEKCQAAERFDYIIRKHRENIVQPYDSKEKRDAAYAAIEGTDACKNGNCAKEDIVTGRPRQRPSAIPRRSEAP